MSGLQAFIKNQTINFTADVLSGKNINNAMNLVLMASQYYGSKNPKSCEFYAFSPSYTPEEAIEDARQEFFEILGGKSSVAAMIKDLVYAGVWLGAKTVEA